MGLRDMPIIDDTTQSPDTAQTPDLKGEEVLKKDLEIQDGRWWRFSAYVIAEYRRPTGSGFRARFEPGPTRPTIRPAPNAVLERFDPWTPHWSTAGKRRTVHPPYADLLELARNLTFVPNHTSFTPTAESANAILEWCAKYGLLGILPARVEVITLQAFWVPRSEAWNDPEARGFCPRYVRYVRRAGQWSETGATTEIPDPPLTEEEATPERLYDAIPSAMNTLADRAQDIWPAPGALVWRWKQHDRQEQDLGRALRRYFPDVPHFVSHAHTYPRPCSEDFWSSYGEPVAEFARWALRFKEAVESVSQMETPRKNPTEADRQRIRVENEALLFLEGLSGTVGTPRRLRPGTRNLVRYVVAPSLLSAFAEMFLEDAELGRRALRCDTCGMFFVSDEPHARYCSVRCRNTMQRRRQRQRAELDG